MRKAETMDFLPNLLTTKHCQWHSITSECNMYLLGILLILDTYGPRQDLATERSGASRESIAKAVDLKYLEGSAGWDEIPVPVVLNIVCIRLS